MCDNISAVYLSTNPVQHQRTKHVEIDLHFVRDRVAIGDVRVLHVPTISQFADIFTKGYDEIAQLLLSRGAIVDIASFEGTPLHAAAVYGKTSIMQILLEHHADVNNVSAKGCTPLPETLLATSERLNESMCLKCMKLLVKAGADLNRRNPQTPLVIATIKGLAQCVEYLLGVGADANIPADEACNKPIEIAAESGKRKLVEILFPFTSPILAVSKWSVEGIIAHAKSINSKEQDKASDKDRKAQLKLQGGKAVERKDYAEALKFYSEAINLDPANAILYSNRSFCHLKMGKAQEAFCDANTCIRLRPEWTKGYYRKGAALMSLKEYKQACDSFMAGIKLDPTNEEIEKAFWEAAEAMKKEHLAGKRMVNSMKKKAREKLSDMNIDFMGLLQLAVREGKLEVYRYFVEDLRFDMDRGGLCDELLVQLDHVAQPVVQVPDPGKPAREDACGLLLEVPILQILLHDGAMRVMLSLNRSLPYGTTGPDVDFFEAAFEGDIPRLKEMAGVKDADEKARLADACFGGIGPLQAAARLGRLDVVRYMVEELGFDVNHEGPKFGMCDQCASSFDFNLMAGFTALSSAALDGKLDIVRYLLDKGADPNKIDEQGQVPLHCAAKHGHEEVARLLLSRGASVDIAYFHGTPLHIAAAFGKTNVMRVLSEHHADPNMVSEVLGTPLVATIHATTEGLEESISMKCVKLLVESGADVNSTDPDTPLVVATTHGLTDCIKYLLKAGANANIPKNCCGSIPIEIAAGYGRRKHVEMLFPFTSPIQTVSKWTVDGIIAHAKSKSSKHSQTKVQQYDKSTKDKLKLDGDKAVGRKDYLAASELYGKAIELDPADATLYSNRSLCLLKIGEETKALCDANSCIKMRSEWLKGYYRKGAALMSLKEYKEACDAFMAGLKLDPANTEMERMFR
ncbi:hypothetical protein U9M48_010164 [Paspalum notatum var. saurae]|uniref:Uncharacterized protein n=1 Tax=Paspalum notatum var. saurae TaxID=547442 RepID=A0AAQ3WFZ7_PASNO